MKTALLNQLREKAKTKKNGFYRFLGSAYRVENHCVTHCTDERSIVEVHGHFVVEIGRCGLWTSEALRDLKKAFPVSP